MKKSLALLLFAATSFAQTVPYAPDRRSDEGEGPFQRLIIRGATLVDGTGAPPVGPVDIVVEGNRIREIRCVGYPKVPFRTEYCPSGASREICGTYIYVLHGSIDIQGHARRH